MLFLLGIGGCYFYVLQLIVTCVSRRTCLFMLFDEQRHLVRYFRGILVPFAEYSNFVCILSYLLVSRFSLAHCRAICFIALVKILAEDTLS